MKRIFLFCGLLGGLGGAALAAGPARITALRTWPMSGWEFVGERQDAPIELEATCVADDKVKFVTGEQTTVLNEPYAEQAIALQEPVYRAEMKVAQPQVCLFLIGPHYDFILQRDYPGTRFIADEPRRWYFARLEHPDSPRDSFRTYHPRGMRHNKVEGEIQARLATELGWPQKAG